MNLYRFTKDGNNIFGPVVKVSIRNLASGFFLVQFNFLQCTGVENQHLVRRLGSFTAVLSDAWALLILSYYILSPYNKIL